MSNPVKSSEEQKDFTKPASGYQKPQYEGYVQPPYDYYGGGYPPNPKSRKFVNEFPRAKSYNDQDSIAETFPHLKDVNKDTLDVQSIKNGKCFVLRSNNDDDIHKAIKYELWISTPQNNEFLNRVYLDAREKKQDVYLFYSVVKSGQFVGVAKMISAIQDKNFPYWWQSHKWKGQFSLQWIYIKDVSYKFFEKIYNINNLPVIRSKDCTEIDWHTNGRQMLQIFKEQPVQPNIFQEFDYMDCREDWLISQRQMQKMYKQNMSGYYPNPYSSNYMSPQMGYMYPGYAPGIPGAGYYDEKNGDSRKKGFRKEEEEEEKL